MRRRPAVPTGINLIKGLGKQSGYIETEVTNSLWGWARKRKVGVCHHVEGGADGGPGISQTGKGVVGDIIVGKQEGVWGWGRTHQKVGDSTR